MSDPQFHEELSIIRNMIERTRRDTFQSGYLFIIPGIIWLVSIAVMAWMEMTGRASLVFAYGWIPFAVIFIASLSIGFWDGAKNKVRTYPRDLFSHLWFACGIVIMLIVFVVPRMAHDAAVAPLMIIGLGFYMTGVIYDLKMVQVSGILWWAGLCALGFIEGILRLPIWLGLIFFGFILPGIMLNRLYRKQGNGHGA